MRVAVILHERLGGWHRQLRPRLAGRAVRWFESRSTADLAGLLEGLAAPVVLIDLARQPVDGLAALELVRSRAPGARTLVLDPAGSGEVRDLARELGATHLAPGLTPPPIVAALIARWVELARRRAESAGWSRTDFPESTSEPWAWLSRYLNEPGTPAAEPATRNGRRRLEYMTQSSHDRDRLLTPGEED
jgi:hypothetical protein